MAKNKKYEYRFIMPEEYDEPHQYERGRVLKRKKGNIFRTVPYDEDIEPEEYPIETTRKEKELSGCEILDILMDWNAPYRNEGEIPYKSVAQITREIRELLYDDA